MRWSDDDNKYHSRGREGAGVGERTKTERRRMVKALRLEKLGEGEWHSRRQIARKVK